MKDVEKTLVYLARNMTYGGVVVIITALYLVAAEPRNILVLWSPYNGDRVLLSGVLVLLGSLSALLGYALRRIS